MKKLLILSAFSIFIFAACKKDSATSSTNIVAINTIEFYVDGVKQTYGAAYAIHGKATLGTGYILTVGSNQISPTIQVKAFDSVAITPKTYTADGLNDIYSYTFYGAYQTSSISPKGYVKITSFTSTNVQGEFTDSVYRFSTNDWKVLKQGRFNVNF